MSFVDYGFEVFPFSLQNRINAIQSCGDYLPSPAPLSDRKNSRPFLENSCYQLIIEHLIYLGTCTENELALVQSELEKYKRLQLTEEQIKLLRRLDADCKKLENIRRLTRDSEIETDNTYYSSKVRILCDGDHDDCWRTLNESKGSEHCHVSLNSPREDERNKKWCSCSSENVSPRKQSENAILMSEESFRATIIQKDSEIISLKNDNAVKETEVKELEEEKRKLEVVMEKMRSDIELLESSSRISQSSIEEVIQQKNAELNGLRQNSLRIEEKLNSEHEARISAEQKLQTVIGEIQALRKNLAEEAKMAKRRVQALEASNASQATMIKQLQQERESLEKQSSEQENEIEKLLSIMGSLNEKHDRLKMELSASERRVGQCREQLEKVEREVSRLIAELSDCLGRVDPSIAEPMEEDLYARASQLTRGLSKFVNEYGRCQADRQDLLQQINRLRAQPLDRMTNRINTENYRAIKSDLQGIVDELLSRLDEARRLEKSQRAYLQLAGEASLALQKLEQKIDDHHVYKRCESFLLLELENLQDALDGAEKTINGLECNKIARTELSSDYSEIEAVLSKKILQRVQNSTQIVIRITTALRDDSKLKTTYNRNLESQLQQALLALNEIGIEKCQLQSEYTKTEEQRKELIVQVERLRTALTEKSEELESSRKQASLAEKKFQDSRSENAALIAKSDEMIESLQRELQNREAKLRDYGKFNDFLNGKLEESNRMIEQLQNSIVRENMRKLDLDSFTALHERILELVAEKDELTDKIAMLQSQLASYERNNNKLQTDLTKLLEDNESLERAIRNFKSENERLASHMVKQSDTENANIRAKCDEMLERMGKISRDSSRLVCQRRSSSDKEIKAHKDKLCYQEKELMMKEREIVEMRKSIESLEAEITELRKKENSCALLKRIEILTREKSELKDELKQTLAKYDDKLAEMHKQYKQSEIELHKKHNDSIRRLEAKYTEMMREEGGVFNSQNWLQSLSPSELQEVHDKICKTPLCSASTYEKELYEEQAKRSLMSKNATPNYGIKKSLQTRKDARGLKNSSSNFVKPSSSRPRMSARESSSNHSIIIPEKDNSSHHKATRCK